MPTQNPSHDVSDTLLAGGLLTAPAWAVWLAEINEILTTISLVAGLVLAGLRIWHYIRRRR